MINVIDAGHGFPDTGATYENPDGSVILERNKAFAIAIKVHEILTAHKVSSCLIRQDNETPFSNSMRLKFAEVNASDIQSWTAIHLNSVKDPKANGAEILVLKHSIIESRELASDIAYHYRQLKDDSGKPLFKWRGIKEVTGKKVWDDEKEEFVWKGDRWSEMAYKYNLSLIPTCLIETFFLSNKKDRGNGLSRLDDIANTIAQGIIKFNERTQ